MEERREDSIGRVQHRPQLLGREFVTGNMPQTTGNRQQATGSVIGNCSPHSTRLSNIGGNRQSSSQMEARGSSAVVAVAVAGGGGGGGGGGHVAGGAVATRRLQFGK